ncbi:cell wall hydrolyse [Ameyamaea chiangmaiensis NBRC 103196]|uniref:Cell wall hydrolase n=1 Tax=Ameyamaea chiangmaiensis TaxID=442969 RepID=A0A850P8L8_9PROT|nr:cell wall hydrolase [Ameyamaea chiangmaiensis]MBS4075415.1 cell wall hydrolase [Ameyamaea chiangmaiensis]NVN40324.1 cell wall hydrolase [Ameyamaea chiangmaiensis]GBQ69836.1 cell wall hydrolyse [Ameyamaea chiangmaiensis NBRC 103196]
MLDPAEVAARTAWGEARGEGLSGMQAVLNAIGNRAAYPGWWGHGIAGVCLAPGQFSCWNVDDPNREKLISVDVADKVFLAALNLARRLCAAELPDLTTGADSYYAAGSRRPLWARDAFFKISIGRHRFYRVGLMGDGR